MFAIIVSRINRQVSFPTVTIQSFVSLLSVAVIEGLAEVVKELAKFNIEGEIKIKKYISLGEELIPKTYITN